MSEVRKIKRNLSGIFVKYKNPESGSIENWCFEDLPKKKQEEFLNSTTHEFLKNLTLKFSEVVGELGEMFDIQKYS